MRDTLSVIDRQTEMNVSGQEGVEEAVRFVGNYVKGVERELEQLCKRDGLDLFFTEQHRMRHKKILLDFLKKCADVYALVILIDNNSLPALYTMTASELTQFLSDCVDPVFFKERKLSTAIKMTLSFSQSNNVITWRLSTNEKNPRVKTGTMTVTAYASSFKPQIAAYHAMRSHTKANIERFLEETPSVEEHLGVAYCNERRYDIIQWLHNAFVKRHLIVYIDFEEPNLVRQLLCHPTLSVKSILSPLTKTNYFTVDPEVPCFLKKIIFFKSLALPLSSPEISAYAKTVDLFWISEDGARLIKEHSSEVNALVDVYQVYHEERIRCVSLLERPSYEAQNALAESFEEFDQDRRLKAFITLENNNDTAHLERIIQSCLAAVPELLKYKGNYRVEAGTPEKLKSIMLNSSTYRGGLNESCDVLQDCIMTTARKANTFADEKDLRSFSGDIVFSADKMSTNSFDTKRKLLWTPTENRVMEDERNKFYVHECLENSLAVNTLKLAYGDDEVSRCVIPCVMNRNHYTMNNIIANNNNNNNNNNNGIVFNIALTTSPTNAIATKKRKAEAEALKERIKRIRLINDPVVEGEDKEERLQLVHIKVDEPRPGTFKECIVCMHKKPYSSFYIKKNQIEKNICATCLTQEAKFRACKSQSI